MPASTTTARLSLQRNERRYFYGLYLSDNNKILKFMCKQPDSIPKGVFVQRQTRSKAEHIITALDELYAHYIEIQPILKQAGKMPSAPDNLGVVSKTQPRVGDVICYADGEGHHMGVALRVFSDQCYMLFCTSNPDWNERCRAVTTDEWKLLGSPIRNKGITTYFAPVVRPLAGTYKKGYSFPAYRVEELFDEFFPDISEALRKVSKK